MTHVTVLCCTRKPCLSFFNAIRRGGVDNIIRLGCRPSRLICLVMDMCCSCVCVLRSERVCRLHGRAYIKRGNEKKCISGAPSDPLRALDDQLRKSDQWGWRVVDIYIYICVSLDKTEGGRRKKEKQQIHIYRIHIRRKGRDVGVGSYRTDRFSRLAPVCPARPKAARHPENILCVPSPRIETII